MARSAANLAVLISGKVYTGILGALAVPIYFKALGPEEFGILGVFTTLRVIAVASDLGLAKTITRLIASFRRDPSSETPIYRVYFTFEVVFWIAALLAGVVAFLLEAQVAEYRGIEDSNEVFRGVYPSMIAALLLLVPVVYYDATLQGFESHKMRTALTIANQTLFHGVGVAVLWGTDGDLYSFFRAAIVVGLVSVIISKFAANRKFRGRLIQRRFDWGVVKQNYKYALGAFGIALTGILVSQVDKVLLFGVVNGEEFGYYLLAANLVGLLNLVLAPMQSASFPAFSNLVGKSADEPRLASLYHSYSQLVCILMTVAAVVLIPGSWSAIYLWTGDTLAADQCYRICAFLAVAKIMGGLVRIPASLQLASGITSISFICNILGLIIFLAMFQWATNGYGAAGAAIAQIPQNALYIIVLTPTLHRVVLRSEARKWILNDTLIPFMSGFLVGLIMLNILPAADSRIWAALRIATVASGSLVAATVVAPETRRHALRVLGQNLRTKLQIGKS